MLTLKRLQTYRAKTFHALAGKPLATKEQALSFVNRRGFIYFWPIKGITLPSLWAAVAGDRRVSDQHDDPGHVTWRWKDSLLGKRKWYYAKVLRKKATIIALDVLPYFYALSENYGSPDEDYLLQHEQGRLTQEAKAVYETLLREGALDTIALRKAARLASRESDARFNRAIDELQVDFKILPTGVAEAGAWKYAHIYDLVPRHFPGLPGQARPITPREARQKLAELYFRSVGAAQMRDVIRLFGWRPAEAEAAVEALTAAGKLRRGLEFKEKELKGEWIAVRALAA